MTSAIDRYDVNHQQLSWRKTDATVIIFSPLYNN